MYTYSYTFLRARVPFKVNSIQCFVLISMTLTYMYLYAVVTIKDTTTK